MWFNVPMTTTTTSKTCECGCGAPVARSFKPGHDAKLKSTLIAALGSRSWWVRESAAAKLVERGWGHFAPVETLASIPVRSRWAGRYVETRHLESLQVFIVDQAGDTHSHKSCPRIVGGRDQARWSGTHEGWACGTCIHTAEWVEIAATQAADIEAFKAHGFDPEAEAN